MSSMASNSAREKEAPSAVPWTSTRRPVAGEDEVEIDVTVEVLAVVEIGAGLAVAQADGDGGDLLRQAATRR